MDVLALVGLLVCYLVQRRIRPWPVAIPVSIALTLAAWLLTAFGLSLISPHPLLPAGLPGYSRGIALAIIIALFVAGVRYFLAQRGKETKP